jgi:nitroreductase/NAD-dependent dihydropyrimidine dehydrogenase PreA subunit
LDMFQINEENCNKCGLCATVCPVGLIQVQEDCYPELTPAISNIREASQACNRCGSCVTVCPKGSLTLLRTPLERFPEIDPALQVSFGQCVQLLKSRRSIRAYKDTPVPREDITRLIDAARYAPTGANAQNVSWMVIDDTDKLQRLREIGAEFMINVMKNTPAYSAVADLFLKRKEAGYDIFLNGAPAVVAAYSDADMPINSVNCTIALAYFDLAANCLGLGCCWLGFFSGAANNFPPVKEMLSLPEGKQVYGAMALGYPKYKYHRIPPRKPADITWQS